MKDLYTRIFGHWQMTLCGIGGAGITALGEYVLTGQLTWKGALAAFIVGATGAFKKNLDSWSQPQQ